MKTWRIGNGWERVTKRNRVVYRPGGKFTSAAKFRAALVRKAVKEIAKPEADEGTRRYWAGITGKPELIQKKLARRATTKAAEIKPPKSSSPRRVFSKKVERGLYGDLCEHETRAGLYSRLEKDVTAARAGLSPKEASRVRVHFVIGDISNKRLRELEADEREDRGYRQFGTLDDVERFLTLTGNSNVDWSADSLCQFKKEARVVIVQPKYARVKKVKVLKRYLYEPIETDDESETE